MQDAKGPVFVAEAIGATKEYEADRSGTWCDMVRDHVKIRSEGARGGEATASQNQSGDDTEGG